MAEADLVNGGLAPPKNTPERRKGPSLFERVTGTGRARANHPLADDIPKASAAAEPRLGMAAPQPAPPQPSMDARDPDQVPAAPEPRLEMELAAPSREIAPEPTPAAPEPEPQPQPQPAAEMPAQGDLGSLEPKAAPDKDVQEDLLEIPAFLRRQSN